MSEASVPAVPGGLRAGQLGVIVIGRVIMGDIAVTLVDLARRELLTVSGTGDDGDWLLSPSARPASGRQGQLLDYERRLLNGLTGVGAPACLSALADGFGPILDETRKALVRQAVRQGWLRHLHPDQRTPKGEDLARQVRSFQRDLRRLKTGGDQNVLADLLPYALHFGLISDDQLPLARFAHAWVRTFANLPGWAPTKSERPELDDPIAPATEPASPLVIQMAFLLGGNGSPGGIC
jgi:hypothetical protein